ncbi:MAG: dihydropteroate synthase [Promethearchaeota archaeon]|nr:MAG: dihydropteroate synthase [Candidatus Lokiarchaeota archaeon]
MSKIYSRLFDFLELGDNFPTIIMGVLNLSPESFYKGSVYNTLKELKKVSLEMINNGAKMLDLGARSTAPWSEKISIQEEIDRIVPSMEVICKNIPKNIIVSIDTQYREVAQKAYDVALKFNKKEIIINDVSCLKTDSGLEEFIIKNELPIILMASKRMPGDLLTIDEIIKEFQKTIQKLKLKGYNENNIILDPGIGHWVKEKTHTYDLKIINNLKDLRALAKPILVAISRKSFIGAILDPKNPPKPEERYNGTLSATAIAVFNGAHIVRTHDVNNQLFEITKIAEEIRRNS